MIGYGNLSRYFRGFPRKFQGSFFFLNRFCTNSANWWEMRGPVAVMLLDQVEYLFSFKIPAYNYGHKIRRIKYLPEIGGITKGHILFEVILPANNRMLICMAGIGQSINLFFQITIGIIIHKPPAFLLDRSELTPEGLIREVEIADSIRLNSNDFRQEFGLGIYVVAGIVLAGVGISLRTHICQSLIIIRMSWRTPEHHMLEHMCNSGGAGAKLIP